jgi:hypothetical protein
VLEKPLRNSAVALIAAVAAPILAAQAQPSPSGRSFPASPPAAQPFPPPAPAEPAPPAPAAPAQKHAAPPAAARPAAGAPAVAGTWSGPVTQVGSESKYTVVLTLTAAGGESSYPELHCTGKLTRIGASRSYVFFIEVITQGQREKGGRCPDGSITVARAGDGLAWEWFGSVEGVAAIAYGTLTRKPER